jgi:signal transduction histidine kinase/outer membrane protein assembly factor BamB
MMQRFFLFLLLSVITIAATSQQQHFNVRYYNTENGLPSNGIKGLQWDKQTGFLWVATEAGIVRYNGLEFKNFSSNDEPHITNERILFLVRNNGGKIFTADNTGNVFCVNKNRLQFLEKKFISGNAKSSIVLISFSERLYKGFSDFDTPGSYSMQFNDILPATDSSGFILQSGRLFFISEQLKSPTPVLLPIRPRTAFMCRGEIFLRDSVNNIYILDQKANHLVRTELVFDDNFFTPDIKKNLFIWENGMEFPVLFNETRAYKVDYVNGRLKASFITEQVPQDILIRYVQYDDDRKMLMIGTDSKGLVIIGQNRVESVRYPEAGINQRTSYYSQIELYNGSILTNESHVLGRNVTKSSAPPIKGKFSTNILQIGDSIVLFTQANAKLGYSCLNSYNFKTRETKVYGKIRERTQIVMAISGGKIYFADESGLFMLNADSAEMVFPFKTTGRSALNYYMTEIEPGVLGIAKCNSLQRFNINTGKLDTLFNAGQYCVRTIWKYKDYLFFGTYGGGLYISKNGIVKQLPLDKNKHLLFTHCFIKDEKDFCWISTNRGLFKANLTELIDVFEKNKQDVYYYYFGKNDGMDMTELNGGCTPCAIRMKDQTISFPSMDGLLWVNPSAARPILPEGDIFIDEVLADNRSFNPDSVAFKKMPAKTRELIIRFSVSAWSNKENIYISYRLNDEAEWRPVDIDKGMEIKFNSLPPGKYKLSIRKHNGFGTNNYTYRDIEFYITIPWYKQWWFNVLMLGLLAMLFMWYYNIRTRQLRITQEKLEMQVAEKTKELQQKTEVLEKSDTIKTRLISIISHDIVTPLKFITVAGKNLVDKRKLMTDEMQDETILEMVNTTQELQLLSTNILNWIKYQNENRRLAKETFNLREMVNQVLSLLQSLAKQKNNTIHNKVAGDAEIYQLYEPVKILVYNLLTNAINFTEKGNIYVEAEYTDDNIIIISVRDEGVGMTVEQIQRLLADEVVITAANVDNKKGHGLGYLIIKDLVKTMGATLQIESEKGKGTKVSVYFPVNHIS